jgi:hypothetical protein
LRYEGKIDLPPKAALPGQSFGQLDQGASIRRIPQFFEGNDQPQTLNHAQIDVMFLEQLPQFIAVMIGTVRIHNERSGSE